MIRMGREGVPTDLRIVTLLKDIQRVIGSSAVNGLTEHVDSAFFIKAVTSGEIDHAVLDTRFFLVRTYQLVWVAIHDICHGLGKGF